MRFRVLRAVAPAVMFVTALHAGDHSQRWRAHVEHLAEHTVNNRTPGTDGDRKAAQYIAAELQKTGIDPASGSGYRQVVKVRSRGILERFSSLALVQNGASRTLDLGEDAVVSMLADPAPSVEAPLVFAGYGLSIPELHYDDLAGLDLHGKIAVILQGGPASVPGPVRARYESMDQRHKVLRQRAGAFGIITIQNPGNADWAHEAGQRLEATWNPADPAFEQDDELELFVKFNPGRAETLFEGSGHSFGEIVALANAGAQLPRFPLPASLRARVAVERTETESQNVIGLLPGSDPKLKNEYVVITAHLDRTEAGARDEGFGTAALLEIAASLHDSPLKLRRSVLFVFLAGEQRGMLGSKFFAQYPTVGMGRIVAALDVDVFPAVGASRGVRVYGLNESSLGAQARTAGARLGTRIEADPVPQWEAAIRGDQSSFLGRGIPAAGFQVGDEQGSMKDRNALQAEVSRLEKVVEEVVKAVANAESRPTFMPARH